VEDKMKKQPIALTIAGSDSGGGAGIQADLKTFEYHRVFGTSVITCVTAQNPEGVLGIQAIETDMVYKQLSAVTGFFSIDSIKTGMLYSKEIVKVVVQFVKEKKYSLVLDPVMVATSGAKLLLDDAIQQITEELIPLSTVYTPNADEASILLGKIITMQDNLEDVAYQLYKKYRTPVLLKGGHLADGIEAKDIFHNGSMVHTFSSKYYTNVNSHGTGCTYSSAIAASLAKGFSLFDAIQNSKNYINLTFSSHYHLGKTTSLNHNPENNYGTYTN
jgi:hydroxymethylpyrimidine/phosphomethylpyrimidine kinase